ncbi:hypothetical protein [Arcticibacterium luteifluviistationis]|uniref:Uncharacterized protein n=1 Tax=Arcticibacterium luteifluviistationis TaxID=1784714 RepID=A0A2Z4GGQ6_9BACT|nr:hypothetical protein [Arcticibacterium luteifluviistationis]AWW00205.1 hypothetical protein DJ013_19330 [Arcticibacterium luteifluviistationis]
MRKTKNLLAVLALLLTFVMSVQAQNDNSYFVDNWNVLVKGTPEGDAELPMRFEMNGDVMSGYFVNPESGDEEEMDSAEIKDGALQVAFFIAGYDVTMTLKKETENTMKGSLMGMFEAEASRVVEDKDTYFMGRWNVFVEGTPEGDVEIPMRFEMNGETVSGYFTNPEGGEEEEMDSAEIKEGVLNMAFFIVGYDVTITLKKETENTMKGSLMEMFVAEGTRVIEKEPMEALMSIENYYLSSWDVLIVGTPNGDVTIPMRFEEGDNGLKGYVTNPEDESEIEMTSVAAQDSMLTGGFSMMGYDLNFYLKVVDENQAKGSLMEMFSMTATRKED